MKNVLAIVGLLFCAALASARKNGRCPAIKVPINGKASGQCAKARQGEKCEITCLTGFALIGPQYLVCDPNGLWSGSTPSCHGITCPEINAPINGAISGQCAEARQGGICEFTCLTGFTLVGPHTLVCGPSGSWDGEPPSCE